MGVDEAQAGFGLDAADAGDRGSGALGGGLHGGAGGGRGGEGQFVVVAAGEDEGQQGFQAKWAFRARQQGASSYQSGSIRDFDNCAHLAGFQDVAQVAGQPVADVDGAVGDAAQRGAERQAGRGALQPLAGLGQRFGGQVDLAAQRGQRQARIAQRAADPQVVARARAVAPQRVPGGHLAEDGDAQGQRPGRGVAADQRAAVGIGQREQALRQRGQPGFILRALGRQRQGQGEGQRLGAHGGQVAQVDGQRLVAERGRVDVGEEVAAFDQQVGADGELHAGRGLQQGAVVTDAKRY